MPILSLICRRRIYWICKAIAGALVLLFWFTDNCYNLQSWPELERKSRPDIFKFGRLIPGSTGHAKLFHALSIRNLISYFQGLQLDIKYKLQWKSIFKYTSCSIDQTFHFWLLSIFDFKSCSYCYAAQNLEKLRTTFPTKITIFLNQSQNVWKSTDTKK